MRDPLAVVALCIAAAVTHADAPGPRQWAVEDQGFVYIAGETALFRVDADGRSLTEVTLPPRLGGSELVEIGLFEGFLWIATDSAVANADARYLDWVVYGTSDGCPLPGYAGMTPLDGEVWVAGRRALGRFDQMAERWTAYPMPVDSLIDIATFGDRVWLAAPEALIQFDADSEKTRVFRCGLDVPIRRVSWLERVGEELWAFGPGGIARYVPATESWQLLACPDVAPSQVLTNGAIVWMIGPGGIAVYDAASQSCRRPPWTNRVIGTPRDATLHQGRVYISTDSLLVVYEASGDPAELRGDLSFPGEVDGLVRLPLRRIVGTGTRLLATGDGFAAAFQEEERQWWVVDLSPRSSSPRREALVRIGDGLECALWSPPLIVSGAYTYLMRAQDDSTGWDLNDRHRIRLSGRSGFVSAFFDNTDQLLGDRYGMILKGGSSATLRELGAGWNRADAELMDLTGHPGYRGGFVWLERGERSARRGRRPMEARGWVGERTTRHVEEYRSGGESSYSLAHGNVVIGSVKVYLDDRLLDEGSFTLDHSSGTFFLSFLERDLVTEDSIIRIVYDYWLPEGLDRPVMAGPHVMVNRGDSWSLALGSLIERDGNKTHTLVSCGAGVRSDPGLAHRISAEAEVLGDPEGGNWGSRASASYTADRIDLQGGMLALPGGIETEGRIHTRYGPLERELAFSGRLEPSRSLPALWRVARRSTGGGDGYEGDGKLMWTKAGLPALSLDVGARDWNVDTLHTAWRKIELGGDYSPGSAVGFEKLRAQVLVRQSTDDSGMESTRHRSALARMHVRPAGAVDLTTLVWGRRADDASGGSLQRRSSSGSGLLTGTAAPMEGLSIYVRGEARATTEYADSSEYPRSKDVGLDRSVLLSAVVRPGTSPVELEGSFSRSLLDLFDDVSGGSTLWSLLGEVGGSSDMRQRRSRVIGGGPLVFLPAQSTLRIRATEATSTSADSARAGTTTLQRTYLVRLDVRPMSSSRWLLEGSRSTTRDVVSETDSRSAYARWERRWNPLLLSRIAFNGTMKMAAIDTWSWSPSAYLQLGPGTTGLEVRGEIGAGRRRTTETQSFINGNLRLELHVLGAFLARAEVSPEVVFPESGAARATATLILRAGATL